VPADSRCGSDADRYSMNPFSMHGRRGMTQTLAACLAAPGAGALAKGLPAGRRWWLLGDRTDQAVDEHPSFGQHVRADELARLEAAMFLAREPLTTRRLAKLARLPDGTRARALLRELRRLHDASGAAFRVEHIAGGYQLLTRGPFGPWVRRLLDQPSASRLSAAALETLAIVAYRQPVTRAEIEAIRGVGSEEMLRHLLERDVVAPEVPHGVRRLVARPLGDAALAPGCLRVGVGVGETNGVSIADVREGQEKSRTR
jgi:segregation and condensation protein B